MQSIVHYKKKKKENQKLKVVYDFVTYKSRNDQKKKYFWRNSLLCHELLDKAQKKADI